MTKKKSKVLTGTVPSNRTEKALRRRAQLIARLEAEGLSPEEAKQRAMETMRDNPRGDWRNG